MADFGFDFASVDEAEQVYDDTFIDSGEKEDNVQAEVDQKDIPVPDDVNPAPTSGTPQSPVLTSGTALPDPLASLSSDALVDSIDDASPKVLEAVLPAEFSEDNLGPLDRLCIRSQSSLPFLRVWAAREIKTLLYTCSVREVLETIFPVAFQLSTDKDHFVRETMVLDLTPLLLYYYNHAYQNDTISVSSTNSDDPDSSASTPWVNPIIHTLIHNWLETLLLDPSLAVMVRVQNALVSLGQHLEFELYHTEVIHHTILSLTKATLKSRPPSIDGLTESLRATGLGFVLEPVDEDQAHRRTVVCLRLIRALVDAFGMGLKPAVFVPTIEKTAQSESYEIRRDTAVALGSLARALSYDLVLEGLFPIFQQLIQDGNWQVRQATVLHAFPVLAQILTYPGRSSPVGFASKSLFGSRPVSPNNSLSQTRPSTGGGSPLPSLFGMGQTSSGLNNGVATMGGTSSNGTYHPAPAPPVTAKQWINTLERLLGNREVSYPVQTAVYQIYGRLMVAFAGLDKVKDTLVKYYMSAVANSLDQDVMSTPEITFHCAYNFPAMLLTLGVSHWDELADFYMQLTKLDHFEVRKTLAHSLHEVARMLGPNHCEKYLESVICYFLVDLDEVQLAVISNLAAFVECLYPHSRERCLPSILEAFRHEGSNWRAREIMARQVAPLCRLYPVRMVVRHLLPLAVHWAEDPVAAVREAAAGAFPVVFDLTKEDPGLQVQFFESMIHFRAAKTFRGRLFFVQICEALLAQKVDPTDFEQFFLPSLLALAEDKVANVRIAVARALKRILAGDQVESEGYQSTSHDGTPADESNRAEDERSSSTVPVLVLPLEDPPAASLGVNQSDTLDTTQKLTPMEQGTDSAKGSMDSNDSGSQTSTLGQHSWTDTRSQLITDLVDVLRTDSDRDVKAIMQELPLTILGERPVENFIGDSNKAKITAVGPTSPPLHLQPQVFSSEVVSNHLNLDLNDARPVEDDKIGDHAANLTTDQVPAVHHAPTMEKPALNVPALASASLDLDRAKEARQGDSVPSPREAIEIARPEFNLPCAGQEQQRVLDDSRHIRESPHPLLGTALRRVSFHGFLPRSSTIDPGVGRSETVETPSDFPQALARLTRTPSPPSAIKPYAAPPVRRSLSHPPGWSDMEEGNRRDSLMSLNQTNVVGAPSVLVSHPPRTYSPGLVPPSPKLKGDNSRTSSRPNDPLSSALGTNTTTTTTSHFLERFTSAKFF
ncbi:hypothetical protein IWQ62_000198 [Dispira parvispora]|uniref:Uncharacterized protein n=1 Tax=Dispira parvispora TaxID=1520584 RepID=A0A9W8AVC6_9FUNG|nr:hypothetical protein IWQ62_000198 [Dispira parvispora]